MGDQPITALQSDLSLKFLSPTKFSHLERSNERRLLVQPYICETAVGFLEAANTNEVHLLSTSNFAVKIFICGSFRTQI